MGLDLLLEREDGLKPGPDVDHLVAGQNLAGLAVAEALGADPAGSGLVPGLVTPAAGASGGEGLDGSMELPRHLIVERWVLLLVLAYRYVVSFLLERSQQ